VCVIAACLGPSSARTSRGVYSPWLAADVRQVRCRTRLPFGRYVLAPVSFRQDQTVGLAAERLFGVAAITRPAALFLWVQRR